jgi:hypothetical protein
MELRQFVKTAAEEAMEASKFCNYASRRFEYQDEKFVIAFTASSKTLHVWADNGLTKLFEQRDVTTIDEATTLATEIIDCYLSGEILCSGCGHRIKKEEVAGHYFAGSYCKVCWENKYQAMEAAETYE